MDMITILQIMIGIFVFVICILGIVLFLMNRPKKKKEEENTILYTAEQTAEEEKKTDNYGRFQGELTEESIFKFMEFDEVVDNMIVRKKKTHYVMVLQCNGVNYDLMSEQDKIGVEEGFVQFLNTLKFPIQLYVQSRTLNMKDIIAGYKQRISSIKADIDKVNMRLQQAKREGKKETVQKLEFEKRRKENMLSYGADITDYIERLNSNKNILQQRTYVVVSYFVSELGGNLENYSKDEIVNMVFSELYTRCQNVSSALATSGVTSRILSSEELVELLYIAYNRDEAGIYQLEKALDSQYDALYSTGKDILEKKQEKLDREINIEAIDLATDSILRADKQKQLEDLERERQKTDKVKEMASKLLDTYEEQLNPRVYQIAKENIKNSSLEEEPKKVTKKTVATKQKVPVKRTVATEKNKKQATMKRKTSAN